MDWMTGARATPIYPHRLPTKDDLKERFQEEERMDNTKLEEELCAVIDRMNVIIQAQAMELAQFGALVHEEEIAAVRRRYARAVGEGVGP